MNIKRMAIDYGRIESGAAFRVMPFYLPMHELPDARPTAQRLSAVVRKAQKDFQFATIFEQRKTNRMLAAGFSTLVSAIYEMGDAISSLLNDLSMDLHVSLSDLLDETRSQTEQARSAAEKQTEILREHRDQVAKHAAERREFERKNLDSQKKQEEMLDNLQLRRKP